MSLLYYNATFSIVGIPYYKQIANDEWYEQKVYDDLIVIYQKDNQTRPWWFQREVEREPVPPKKRSELEKCQKPPWDLWYSVSTRYPELSWWVVQLYYRRGGLALTKTLTTKTKHQSHFFVFSN